MKKFTCKILIFSLVPIVYSLASIVVMPLLLSTQNGPSTRQQITFSFKNALENDYEILILGNSRTYRGLNPDCFTKKTFNFSHDNDSYNQIFYKMVFLDSHNKDFDYLILGIDYFQFSFNSRTRDYIYIDFFDKSYSEDLNAKSFKLKLNYYLDNANPNKLLSLITKESTPFLKENGQYIKPGKAIERDKIERDINRLKFQEDFFKKTIDFCKSKNIKVFIVMLPTRINELSLYTEKEIKEFNDYIESFLDYKTIFYLNFSENKGFNTEDYTDITHFNENASNIFSKILNEDILKLIENIE